MIRWILPVLFLGLATGCLTSHQGAPDAGSDTSSPPRIDEVAEQVKVFPGGVAAPSPDPTDIEKSTAEGSIEVLCRPASEGGDFKLRLKGQVFKYGDSGLQPCAECARKILRVLPDCLPGEKCLWKDTIIQESGLFNVVARAADPFALSLYVMESGSDPDPAAGCGDGSCIKDPFLKLRSMLVPEEGTLEQAIEKANNCPSDMIHFKKNGIRHIKVKDQNETD